MSSVGINGLGAHGDKVGESGSSERRNVGFLAFNGMLTIE